MVKANRMTAKYPEPLVRSWFDRWVKSRRPLREIEGDGIPCAAVLGRLFRLYFLVEYEDAVESKQSRRYQIGRAFEYRCRDALKKVGYAVFRSPQSKGPADLIAIRRGVILAIQCKTRRDSMGTQEREELRALAEQIGGTALLAWRGRRGQGINWEALDGQCFLLS